MTIMMLGRPKALERAYGNFLFWISMYFSRIYAKSWGAPERSTPGVD
jgi:hypothetical protein